MVGRRPLWIVLVALFALLLLPGLARAQGLRSTTASVSLSATRLPDSPRRVHDISWEIGTVVAGDTAFLLRQGSSGPDSIYVRDASGRLRLVDATGVEVAGPVLQLRAVTSAATSGAWPIVLRVRSSGHVDERRHVLRATQPR